jgi:hypothetical protein
MEAGEQNCMYFDDVIIMGMCQKDSIMIFFGYVNISGQTLSNH